MSAQASDIDVPIEALLNRTACLVPDVREFFEPMRLTSFAYDHAAGTITVAEGSPDLRHFRAGDVVSIRDPGIPFTEEDSCTIISIASNSMSAVVTGLTATATAATRILVATRARVWTKPAHALLCHIQGIGPGAPGATGTSGAGGAGGMAGEYVDAWMLAHELPASLTITQGAILPTSLSLDIGGLWSLSPGGSYTPGDVSPFYGGAGGAGGSAGAGDPGANGTIPRLPGGTRGGAGGAVSNTGGESFGWGGGGGGGPNDGGSAAGGGGGGGGFLPEAFDALHSVRSPAATQLGSPAYLRITTWCGVNTRT